MGGSRAAGERTGQQGVDAAARMRLALEEARGLGLTPVAIYGAGRHTAKVISALLEASAEIAGFVDDSPSRQTAGVCGWRVVASSGLRGLGAKALILNTDRHEAALWARRGEFESQGVRVFRLYPELDAAASGDPKTLQDIETAIRGSRPLDQGTLHTYWTTRGRPETDGTNAPEAYLSRVPWSAFLADWIADLGLERDARILELGCNIGRNLAFLHYRGYRNLCGIEINPAVAGAMRSAYPETAKTVELTIGSLEDVLPRLPDRGFDLVFAMATLMHIHPDVQGCLEHIPRITRRYICTIDYENRDDHTAWHFPRDYGEVFTRMGCRQIRSLAFADAGAELTTLLNLEPGYVARLLEKG